MPLANSYNTLSQGNEQPGYQMLWEPMAINPASTTTAITYQSTAVGAWVAGAALQYGATGTSITAAGTNWPAGASNVPPAYSSTAPVGDDYGGLSTPYTVQTVDIAAVSSTLYMAGVLLGVGTLGANSPVAPNAASAGGTTTTPRLPGQIAMVGKRGICQVLVDTTTTVGHSLTVATTSAHTGLFTDAGNTTRTFGTVIGWALQAVTVTTAPLLCWAYVNFPY